MCVEASAGVPGYKRHEFCGLRGTGDSSSHDIRWQVYSVFIGTAFELVPSKTFGANPTFEEQVRDSPSPARFRAANFDQFCQFFDIVRVGGPHDLDHFIAFADSGASGQPDRINLKLLWIGQLALGLRLAAFHYGGFIFGIVERFQTEQPKRFFIWACGFGSVSSKAASGRSVGAGTDAKPLRGDGFDHPLVGTILECALRHWHRALGKIRGAYDGFIAA